jgi:hypothetical protein
MDYLTQTPDGAQLFGCLKCGYSQIFSELFINHMRIKHKMKVQVYKCRFCEHRSVRKDIAHEHMEQSHFIGSKIHQCPLCEYCTPTYSLFVTHRRVKHSMEAPHYLTIQVRKLYVLKNDINFTALKFIVAVQFISVHVSYKILHYRHFPTQGWFVRSRCVAKIILLVTKNNCGSTVSLPTAASGHRQNNSYNVFIMPWCANTLVIVVI